MQETLTPAPALSQESYLQRKLAEIEDEIQLQQVISERCNTKLTDLYFQKGKIYSELELTKRIRPYED